MLIPPRFGIGEYTSNDENDPDEIIFKIISLDSGMFLDLHGVPAPHTMGTAYR